MTHRRLAFALAAAVCLSSSARLRAASRASGNEPGFGPALHEALAALPSELRIGASRFLAFEDVDALKKASESARIVAAGGAATAVYGEADMNTILQALVPEKGNPEKAAREIKKVVMALEPLWSMREFAGTRDWFAKAFILAKRNVPSVSEEQIERQVRRFLADYGMKPSETLPVVADRPLAPGVVPLDQRLRRPRPPEENLARLRAPAVETWTETRFAAQGGESWTFRLRTASADKTGAHPDGEAQSIAGLRGLSLARAQAFAERLPVLGPVRGKLRKKYVLIDEPQSLALVNEDEDVFLILGPGFRSEKGVYSKGRILIAGAETKGPVVSSEAIVVGGGSAPDGLLRAPAVFMELSALPGPDARVAAVDFSGYRAPGGQ